MTADPSQPAYLEPLSAFRPEKASQLCAYFALKCERGIEKLKLIKLIYLAEREYLARYSEPILWDEFYSLPHGPICSATLNCIDGHIASDISSSHIVRHGNIVWAVKSFTKDDLDELSEAEFAMADEIWARHKNRTASQLRNFSHQHCPEYTEISRGRVPISYEAVLEAMQHSRPEEAASEIEEYRRVIAQFA